jgi:hypothetical protein
MTQGHKAARRPAVSRPRPLSYALVILMASGCATSGTTLAHHELGAGHVIYRISEERAFTTALEAYAYWYDYSGSGTMWPTAKRKTELLNLIRPQLDATGTAVGPISEQEYQAKRRQILDRI